jgi:lysine-ketoglutarate reductase/saccharopine dehydrogenase-like protein (TIGR00300 family)
MKYVYTRPNFADLEHELTQRNQLVNARFEPAPANGIAPERFYTTTNYPSYVRREDKWELIRRARMDCAVVIDPTSGKLISMEPRKLKKSDLVLVGQAVLAPNEEPWKKRICETGEEGIYVHVGGFSNQAEKQGEFSFMSGGVSPEYPVEYTEIAGLLEEHRNDNEGFSIWVLGPAVIHSGGRKAMQWLVEQGFVGTVFGGNGVATHDLELSMIGTSLGRGAEGGHRHHLTVLNKIRELGSIHAAVEAGLIKDGIMYACDRNNVPFVLTGTIRDDGPLPEVITDSIQAQDAMREHTVHATLVITIATVLHSVATGNMLPVYIERKGQIAPVELIAVDVDQFAVTKLMDRGSHQAIGIVRNAADFLSNLVVVLKQRQGK